MQRIEQSTRVYENLTEADRLLPEADLLPIVQPQFEAAKDEAELDAVTAWADSLLEGARQVADAGQALGGPVLVEQLAVVHPPTIASPGAPSSR